MLTSADGNYFWKHQVHFHMWERWCMHGKILAAEELALKEKQKMAITKAMWPEEEENIKPLLDVWRVNLEESKPMRDLDDMLGQAGIFCPDMSMVWEWEHPDTMIWPR